MIGMDKLATLLLLVGCGLCLVERVWSDTEYQQLAAPEVTRKIVEHTTHHHINKRKIDFGRNSFHNSNHTKKWPKDILFYIEDARFHISRPYLIPLGIKFEDNEVQAIRNIIQHEFQAKTCLNFTEVLKPFLVGQPYIYFSKNSDPTKCEADVGIQRSLGLEEQFISLGKNCFAFRGDIIAMVASTLGMYGEIQRPMRDIYVDIYRENFQVIKQQSYGKDKPWPFNRGGTYNVPYDYGSVMHLAAKKWLKTSLISDPTAFTVLPKDRRFARGIGQQSEFSIYDVMALNRAYCFRTCASSNVICKNGGFLDPHDCTSCKCPDGFGSFDCSRITGSESCNPSSGELTAQPQIKCISSPQLNSGNFNYAFDTTCSWVLKAAPGKRIDAWFQALDLPSPGAGFRPCLHWVELKVGGRNDVRGPRYCNSGHSSELPANFRWTDVHQNFAIPSRSIPIISDQNEIMVIFKAPDFRIHEQQQLVDSDGNPVKYTGFQMCYKISSRTYRVTTTRKPDQPITWPSYPDNNGNNNNNNYNDNSDNNNSGTNGIGIGIGLTVFFVALVVIIMAFCCCRCMSEEKAPTTTTRQVVNPVSTQRPFVRPPHQRSGISTPIPAPYFSNGRQRDITGASVDTLLSYNGSGHRPPPSYNGSGQEPPPSFNGSGHRPPPSYNESGQEPPPSYNAAGHGPPPTYNGTGQEPPPSYNGSDYGPPTTYNGSGYGPPSYNRSDYGPPPSYRSRP